MDTRSKAAGCLCLVLAFLGIALALQAQDTADINNIFEVVVNNTNLAPSVAGHPPGTGERVSGTTYWANSSPIQLLVFSHANVAGDNAEIHLNINGTKVADTSGRPLGGAETSNKTIIAIIPKGANYSVDFLNFHHYEWREYPILAGKNGTLSVNQTFIGSSFNATYDAYGASKVNKTGDNMTGTYIFTGNFTTNSSTNAFPISLKDTNNASGAEAVIPFYVGDVRRAWIRVMNTTDPEVRITQFNPSAVNTIGFFTSGWIRGYALQAQTGSAICANATGWIGVNTGQTTCLASTESLKSNISYYNYSMVSNLSKLKPANYYYDPDGKYRYGLLAEDLFQIIPELVNRDENENINGIRYEEFTSVLLKGFQEQQDNITRLQNEVKALSDAHNNLPGIVSVKLSANKNNLTSLQSHVVPWDVELSDPNNDFYNYNYTAPRSGWYQLNVKVVLTQDRFNSFYKLYIYKNNLTAATYQDNRQTALPSGQYPEVNTLLYLNQSDRLYTMVLHSDTTDSADMVASLSYFNIYFVR